MEIELSRAVGLLDYLGRVAWQDGEEVVITNNGKPYLKLVAHPDGDPIAKMEGTRGIGQDKNASWFAPDLPETSQEIIDAFEGKYSNDDHLFEGFLIHRDTDAELGDSN
jgi:antitoxin (DNA-binding transcriptional repressor) of toxin-antitoxin stability system